MRTPKQVASPGGSNAGGNASIFSSSKSSNGKVRQERQSNFKVITLLFELTSPINPQMIHRLW